MQVIVHEGRLQRLEARLEANTLKKEIVVNLMEKVKSQAQADSIVEYASAFDMLHKISLYRRLEYLPL